MKAMVLRAVGESLCLEERPEIAPAADQIRVRKKLLFAVDFTNRYPDEKATLCSDAKQAVEKLEAQFK
jgi:hypothetical protein